MTREVIERILTAASGVELDDGRFEVDGSHQLNFYLGQPGQAMVVNEVARGELSEAYASVTTREKNTTLYLEYDAIHALSVRPPREDEARRAGFS